MGSEGMTFLDEMIRFVAPIKRRLSLVVGRAILQAISDDTGLQILRLSLGKDETIEGVERIQNYGFSSVPDAGAEVVVLCVGGNRGQAIAVGVDDSRERKKGLQAGDVAVYRKGGDFILLKSSGIEIHSSGSVVVDAPTVNLSNAGTLKALITEDLIAYFNGHTHAGVTTGPGVTATPLPQIGALAVPPAPVLTSKTKAG